MHELKKITENIYIFTPGENDRPIFGLIQGDSNSIIIDAGNSTFHTKLFLNSIKDIIINNTYAVLTHWHWDHIFGSSELPFPIISNIHTLRQINLIKNMKWDEKSIISREKNKLEFSFCSINMLREIEVPTSNTVRIPDIIFDESLVINLDNTRKAIMIYVGGDHSPDSTIVHLPSEKIVFLGDCISPAIDMKNIFYTKSRLIPLLSKLISLNADYYYESHSMEPILLSEIIFFKEYVLNLINKHGILYDNLNREHFPDKHQNKFINNILKCWDMFIEYN
ncbi:MAG TPA: MBL fold metallo-hydrolase [Victivallales bacterium]|nr:MBL fold metallo-hydrolase [Victivallales bacterium]